MTALPDPGRSRAVLIGASTYHHLEDLPAVRNNLTGFRDVLINPALGGLPADTCRVLHEPASGLAVFRALRKDAAAAEDTLLVYFAGHGRTGARNELYLCLPDTNPDELSFTALAYEQLREAVAESDATKKVVILDCCFSGRALADLAGDEETIIGQVGIEGTYILTATAANAVALAPSGQRYTVFTGTLLDLLRTGIPDGPELLTFAGIFPRLRRTLTSRRLPPPHQQGSDTIAHLALTRNPAYTPQTAQTPMIPVGFHAVPDWFSPENKGASVAVGDVTGNGIADLVVLAVDSGRQPNRCAYRIGRDLDADGNVSAGWTPWIQVPGWFSQDTQGAGIAVADLSGSGKLDLIVFMVDHAAQLNGGVYCVGRDLDADGNVTGGWLAWQHVPWFSSENQGAGIAVADLNGSGRPDIVVMTVDNGSQENRGVYRVGRDLDADGNVTGGWSDWHDMPGWFSWENQGGGVAVADITGNGKPDLVIFGIDNPPQQNQAFYRIAYDIDGDGVPAGAQPTDPRAGWSSLLGVNNWLFWENQGAGIAILPLGGVPNLLVLAANHPEAGSTGFYTTVPLTESPSIHGQWEVLPFNSEVLAIHAAMLPTGRVLFFAGSGNNIVRAADPTFGDVAAGMYASVVWDPQAPEGHNFAHPPTLYRQDGRPFDFFCGGDTLLADGRVLSAGGNQDYNNFNNLGQREAAIFDPVTEQWAAAPPMAHGRGYPQLLLFPDGHVLTVSGKNETTGDLNRLFEVYDPVREQWLQRNPPRSPDFMGLPHSAHLFLMADGRVFFSGGRMDDPSPQRAGIMAFAPDHIDFQLVPAAVDAALRNQSSSVLLPPAQDQQVMIIGGGPADDISSASGITEIVHLDQPNPAYQLAMPLSLPRIHLNAVLLPDRTVFVSGGAIIHEGRAVPPIARLQSEIYDPAMGTWRPGAVASVIRMYHSVALLMPDGQVVTAGGNPPPYGDKAPWQPPQPNEEMRIEMYRPPYMFAAARPAIGEVATEWHYGQAVNIASPQAGTILWAELIRSGVTTHAFDSSQRLVNLPIAARPPGSLTVNTPATPTIAPPGWHMLFLVDQNHIPSTATWIHLS